MYIAPMELVFDPAKNRINIRKHGIDLADVEAVFYDLDAITVEDLDHKEQRFVTLGMDSFGRLLVVCYTYRGNTIRVISARKAEPHERKVYEG
jgi:uncharacterized DUF497 family protein